MDIDPDIANWVLEYFLRQPLDDRILNSVVRALPLPDDNPNLQKSLLLKKLESELSRGSISETMLEFLEKLEEIEFRRGNYAVSDAMKRAYCAVAVDCTLKLLVLGHGDEGDCSKEKFMFFQMVKRLWRERFGRMEEVVKKGGLGSEILSAWKEEVEAAVWDDSVCKSVVKKYEGVQAAEAVRVYLREESEKMGPSFLELVAERVKTDDVLRQIMGVGEIDRVAAEKQPFRAVDQEQPSCRVDGAANGSQAAEEHPCHVDRPNGSRAADEQPSCRVDGAANGSQAADEQPSCRVDGAANGSRAVDEQPSCRVDGAANGSRTADEQPSCRVDGAANGSQAADEQPSCRVDGAANGSRAADKQPSCLVDGAANGGNASKGKHKVKNKHRNKHVGVSRGAKIAETNTESSPSRCSLPNFAQVNETEGDPESSSMEHHVMNPLPEAFRYAEAIYKLQKPAAGNNGEAISREARQNLQTKLAAASTGEASSSKERLKRKRSAEDKSYTVDVAGGVQNASKPSLMQRNSTAHVYEWNDSIDASPEDIACGAVIRLPNPSPLKFYKMKNNNMKQRRKARKWSLQEEDALRKGVERLGQGSWKAILYAFKDEFQDRTDVDLKDKWRNMTR